MQVALEPARDTCKSTLEDLKHYFKMREEGNTDKERLSCCLYDFYFYFPVFLSPGNGQCLLLYSKELRAYE